MKYIVLKVKIDATLSVELPVVFPNILVHANVAKALQALPELKGASVVGAGEYTHTEGACSGESTSLGIKSRGDVDELLLTMSDYGLNYTTST